jgi:hypothetical protein
MKWTVLNALGGGVWIAGLSVAKGQTLLGDQLLSVGDHRMLAGIGFGLAGLTILLWANLRSAA